MTRQSLVAGVIAIIAVTAIVGGILFSTRNNRAELKGEILKVRSHQLDPEHTFVLMDVRLHNPSTQQFLVREVEVYLEEPGGKSSTAEVFADVDAQRVLDYYPVIGKKYNPTLVRRDAINPGKTVDRTISVSVPMTDERVAGRKRIRMVIRDMDGPSSEILEAR